MTMSSTLPNSLVHLPSHQRYVSQKTSVYGNVDNKNGQEQRKFRASTVEKPGKAKVQMLYLLI